MSVKKKTLAKSNTVDVTLEKLLEAGAHFGHQTRRWNPKMASFIYGTREGVHIFDLAKTREGLLAACSEIEKIVSEDGIILFIGTKRQARELVADLAEKVEMPYITERWLGGLLTNFDQVGKSISQLSDMGRARDAGEYKNYTKKERLLIDRKINRLERVFGGVRNLKKLPDALFIIDTHKESTACREAAKLGIPVIGIVDTNADPTVVDFPIPANDDAVKSISVILDVVEKAVKKGQKGKKSKNEDIN